MRVCCSPHGYIVLLLLLAGCSGQRSAPPEVAPGEKEPVNPVRKADARPPDDKSDLEKVRSADISVLFVGNSHTMLHDLPGLVGKMIRFRHPEKTYYSHVIGVSFLEGVGHDRRCKQGIESRPWKYAVLQGQKSSMSGQVTYARKEGIEIAKQAKARGATVFLFSEWGVQGVEDDWSRTKKNYQEMNRAADV